MPCDQAQGRRPGAANAVSARATRIIIAALALWLGLWPSADAATGASRVIVMAEDAAPARACCGGCPDVGRSADTPPEPCGHGSSESAPASCPIAASGRCSVCASTGGLVLFAVAIDVLDPPLCCLGLASLADEALVSTHRQPPVPPPWLLS
jgi:hypothetical protein